MNEELSERFDGFLEKVRGGGIRVDGVLLAKSLLSPEVMERMERLLSDEGALSFIKGKASRIEFITEGPLPPGLMEESPLKKVPIYKQVIGYNLCKACRLCIEICPKHVYKDDGFGRPGPKDRREEECTGPGQCGQCVDICPENAIHLVMHNPVFQSTLFALLPNPPAGEEEKRGDDFFVVNPLEINKTFRVSQKLDPGNLPECHRLLNASGFYPVIEIRGYPRHFVDSRDPEGDLRLWATENGRDAGLARGAASLLYEGLSHFPSLRCGKYRLGEILHRIIDELLHRKIGVERGGGIEILKKIVREAFIEEPFLGAKGRPIGGLLPTGTSPAWKTPYGEEIPDYVHLEKCLGPECGLCVTHCPEGGGGARSAIRMILKVPQGTIPSLVRGLDVFLLRLDGSHARFEDLENLKGKTPFEFEVSADYCKACGICIACCPHDVIEPATRCFDLGQATG